MAADFPGADFSLLIQSCHGGGARLLPFADAHPEASYPLQIEQWRILVARVRFARCTAILIGIVKDSFISSERGAFHKLMSIK
jgi:hypothetical protein